jgi:uncharacterized circularly permuted ATP-grasp superfamily protein
MIKYCLKQDAIIPNVPTFLCSKPKHLRHLLANLDKLVAKAINLSGGDGMLIGPHSTKAGQDDFAKQIKANPRDFVARPTLALSRAPTIVED